MAKPSPAPQSTEDRRALPRTAQQARVIDVTFRDETHPFTLINLSRRGASGRCTAALDPGCWVSLTFENRASARGLVRWRRGDVHGIEIAAGISAQMLRGDGVHGRVDRAPRYAVSRVAFAIGENGSRPALIRNVSRTGMQIEAAGLRNGERIIISCGDAPPMEGQVRWIEGSRAGLRMSEPIDLDRFEEQTAGATCGGVARATRFDSES